MNIWREKYADLQEITRIVDLAIEEDAGKGDITSEALFESDHFSKADVITREVGVIAGFPVFELVYNRISDLVECSALVDEGEIIGSGTQIIQVEGPTADLLKGERTALNFLQRLSGIATRTRRFVDNMTCTGISLLDTRKTTPGLRLLEKYAVRIGGGENHR
jgi:nicotinate-nucleotide pyrophosphorylase (carboxylating)